MSCLRPIYSQTIYDSYGQPRQNFPNCGCTADRISNRTRLFTRSYGNGSSLLNSTRSMATNLTCARRHMAGSRNGAAGYGDGSPILEPVLDLLPDPFSVAYISPPVPQTADNVHGQSPTCDTRSGAITGFVSQQTVECKTRQPLLPEFRLWRKGCPDWPAYQTILPVSLIGRRRSNGKSKLSWVRFIKNARYNRACSIRSRKMGGWQSGSLLRVRAE